MALSGEFEMATSGEQVTAITGLLAPMRGEFASIISGYLIQEYAFSAKVSGKGASVCAANAGKAINKLAKRQNSLS